MSKPPLSGVYLLLDEQWAPRYHLPFVMELAAGCGIRLFQYRNKTGAQRDMFAKARELRDVAIRSDALFIVNDRCDVALAVEADGVHLGQEDLPLDLARNIMGHQKIIGISTHRPEEVTHATRGGADYIGYGPLFPTTTKETLTTPVGLAGLRDIRSLTPLPVFAIGGITLDALEEIVQSGANGVAVASAVLDASHVEQTMRDFISHFPPPSSPLHE
ncbi:MAG: thiamine phosphate synthase [Nitrospira sp.]|nr:thiamine phosphate synthase [Nitrospira sp.]